MTALSARYGVTIPFPVPLSEHRDWLKECVDLGYTDLWSSEADGTDGLTPLAFAAACTETVRLGVAVLPAFLRGPALLAQSVAALAEAAPGRVAIGIGASSDVIVRRWNDIEFERPYSRVRDTVRFLRRALKGERISEDFGSFAVDGFQLSRKLSAQEMPTVLIGALRQRMLRLAASDADGAILNWLGADDVPTVAAEVGAGKELVCRIVCIPGVPAEVARTAGRRLITAYLSVPVYAAFHQWLGRAELLRPMWDAWAAGDRRGALAAIPDQVVDDLIVHGSSEECRDHIARYVASGVTTPVVAFPSLPDLDARAAMRAVSPLGR